MMHNSVIFKELLLFLQDNLKELRNNEGMTQEEVSKLIGVSRATVINIENKKKKISTLIGRALYSLFQNDEIIKKFINDQIRKSEEIDVNNISKDASIKNYINNGIFYKEKVFPTISFNIAEDSELISFFNHDTK
ncbi:helix-turn-helix transcriptional regulator [Brassicibacter mesophilus]|uniref:helix-turn-helix transcriptional regulator n=1 Tax=Brassicibacter mesophilus TaxID=745119 RepID=UPI003D1BC3B6